MYRCVCGYSSSFRSSLESHVRTCSQARRKAESRGIGADDLLLGVGVGLLIDSIFDSSDSSSSSSSSDSFSGGGGDFGGGGSSGDW